MAEEQFTSKEHFIPLCYLGQFSPDDKTADGGKNPFDKRHIYQYDVISGKQTSSWVPIKSICYSKNQYEFQNENGEIVFRNLIERVFNKFEGIFANTFRSVLAKTRCKENYRLSSFLSNQEKDFLLIFLVTQILRSPEILEAGIETAKEVYGSKMSDYEAKNMTLRICLPIYREIKPEEKTALNELLTWFEDMSFQIGVADKDVLFTSDHPTILTGEYGTKDVEAVFLTISPRVVLFMHTFEKTPKGQRNCMVSLEKDAVKIVNGEIAARCKRWIYSKAPLTNEQIDLIKEGRRLRNELLQHRSRNE